MICPYCSFDNPDGTIFCDDCNMPLPVSPISNPQIPSHLQNFTAASSPAINPTSTLQKPKLSLIAGGALQNDLPRMVIIENLLPTGETLRLPRPPYPGDILLGRNDLKNSVVVDIDLTGAGGFQKKVSRKHAYLGHDGSNFTIKDAGSTHGTFINKTKLTAGNQAVIQSGDEIRLAELAFKIE